MASKQYMKEVLTPPISVCVRHGYLQAAYLAWNGSHRLMYHVYTASGEMHLKDAIEFAYGYILAAEISTKAYWEARKMTKAYVQEGKDVISAESADVSGMRYYLIVFGMRKE